MLSFFVDDLLKLQVMLGFQHADLNFPADFQQQEEAHQDVGANGTNSAGTSSAPSGWPSCAQQNSVNNPSSSVTSTTGKKSDSSKSTKKNNDTNTTKKKKTRYHQT